MAFSRVSLRLLPQEYDSFLEVIKNDPRLPTDYDEWIRRIREQDAHHIANAEVIKEVVVNYKEFAKYCVAAGMEPCYDMLMALTMTKGSGVRR